MQDRPHHRGNVSYTLCEQYSLGPFTLPSTASIQWPLRWMKETRPTRTALKTNDAIIWAETRGAFPCQQARSGSIFFSIEQCRYISLNNFTGFWLFGLAKWKAPKVFYHSQRDLTGEFLKTIPGFKPTSSSSEAKTGARSPNWDNQLLKP